MLSRNMVRLLLAGCVALLTAAAFTACSPADPVSAPIMGYGLVRIVPTHQSYGAGGHVNLEIENVGPSIVETGFCPNALERLVGVSWKRVTNFDATCDAGLLSIQPGVIAGGAATLPRELPTGFYRLRFDKMAAVTKSTRLLMSTRYSEQFTVTAAAR